MEIRMLQPEELALALEVAGETVTAEIATKQKRNPDLFICCCDGARIVGICCGWSYHNERTDCDMVRLYLIALLPEYQRKGHGSRLLCEWENRVRARGEWTIDLGSGADGFYLKTGYTPVEYAVKAPRDKLPQDYRNLGFQLSYVRDEPESKEVYLYTAVRDRYDEAILEKMRKTYNASSSFTIFTKRISLIH